MRAVARGRRSARDERPVVALESTLVAHGLPWPETSRSRSELEAIVRASRRGAGDDRGRRRAAAHRARRARRSSASRRTARVREGRRDRSRGPPRARRGAATTVSATACSRRAPAFACSRPAASAASIAATPATSRTIWSRSRRRRSRSSRPAPRRSSICRARSRCWRRSASSCSATAPTRCRRSTRVRSGLRLEHRVDTAELRRDPAPPLARARTAAACWSPTRSRPRRGHDERIGPRSTAALAEAAARGRHRQGADAVPARADRRGDRRPIGAREPGAGRPQRRGRRRARRRPRWPTAPARSSLRIWGSGSPLAGVWRRRRARRGGVRGGGRAGGR